MPTKQPEPEREREPAPCESSSDDEDDELDPLLEVPLRRCTLCCLASQLVVGLLCCVALLVLLPVGAVGMALAAPPDCDGSLPLLHLAAGSASGAGGDELQQRQQQQQQQQQHCEGTTTIFAVLLQVALALPLSCATCLCHRHARCAPRERHRHEATVAALMDDRLQVFFKRPGSAAKVVGPVALGELARLIACRQTDKLPSASRIWAVADEVAASECEVAKQVAEESALLDVSVDVDDTELPAAAAAPAPASGRRFEEDERLTGLATFCVNEMLDTRLLPPRPRGAQTGALTPEQAAAASVVASQLLAKLFPTTSVSRPVVLQVYDWNGTAEPMLTTVNSWLGHFIGVYHTGLAIGADEWGYGKTMDERTGVYLTPVGQVIELFGHRLRVAIPLGEVEISGEELGRVQVRAAACGCAVSSCATGVQLCQHDTMLLSGLFWSVLVWSVLFCFACVV
jgi:hypothetical protein